MLHRDDPQRVFPEAGMPLAKPFGFLVALEAAYYSLGSLDHLISIVASLFDPDLHYPSVHLRGWPIGVITAIAWPAVMWGAAFVLLKPRLPESTLVALGRALLVCLAILVNLMLLWGLWHHPEFIIRWPI